MITFERKEILDLLDRWKRRVKNYHDELHTLREINAEHEGKLANEIYGYRRRLAELDQCIKDLNELKMVGREVGDINGN